MNRADVLREAAERVRALNTHEAHCYEPGIEWLCVTSGDPGDAYPRARDCGNEEAHMRLIDSDAVLAILDEVMA